MACFEIIFFCWNGSIPENASQASLFLNVTKLLVFSAAFPQRTNIKSDSIKLPEDMTVHSGNSATGLSTTLLIDPLVSIHLYSNDM